MAFTKDRQFYKFAAYGFLKNLRFFEPFLILFFREMGLSFLQIGMLFSIREIATNLLELPTGLVADIYGRRISMLFSMTSYIISFIIFYFFPNFYIYALAMVLFAFGEAFRTGTHKAMILEYLRMNKILDKRVEYYGSTRAASQLGSAINSLIAAAIVFYSGNYKVVFLAATLPYIFNLINLATYPKELDGEIKKTGKRETFKEFFGIFKNKDSLKGIMNSSIFDAFFKTVKEYLQPVLKSLALSLPVMLAFSNNERTAVVVGIVYFFIYLATSYASKNASKVAKKIGNKEKAINITYLLGAVLIILSGVSQRLNFQIGAVIFFLILFVIENIRRPLNVAYISEKISHKTMASGLSAESQLKTLLTAVLAPTIGFLADKITIGGALVVCGFVMSIFYLLIRLREEK
ncbi:MULTISPECIES: MFS transporter [unclassified Kosmotoga]|uniref:MFS transporter n=1 Tax=unclassified Kosmotoga TaxID=2631489 RepID=UPI0007C44CD0|nr:MULTISPECIES: MFS transporter [unclassified Kosmotoga]MDI3523762.1 hypothetical protein [Kosmotoga sp.]MDK2953397.1 hypothetical protein [Kosmotoga sp.]OAA23690.1 MFS transporter [Kosmotoga sp. DU53]